MSVEAYPLRAKGNTLTVAKVLVQNYILHSGIQKQINTDRKTKFISLA